MSEPMFVEERFRAMGCDAHLIVEGGEADRLLRFARERIKHLEALWSRFLPDSEVSRVNAAAGTPVIVSKETFDLIEHAVAGWRATTGRFDPMLLGAIIGAGYDRTFDEVHRAPGAHLESRRPDASITLDHIVGAVTVPAGGGFDPGGIGKGFAADLVTEELMGRGARAACVNIGGDASAAGECSSGPWHIEISDPFGGPARASIQMREGAVATTSKLRRSWVRDGERMHHVIDPATNTSARTDVAAVTVIAGEAWWAEVWSKAALLAGARAWPELASAAGVTGMLIADDGTEVRAPDFETFAA